MIYPIKSTISEVFKISSSIISTVSSANLSFDEDNINLVFSKIEEINASVTLYQVINIVLKLFVGIVPIICIYLQSNERIKDFKQNINERQLESMIDICEIAKTIMSRYFCWAVDAHSHKEHEIYDKKNFLEIDKELADLQVKFTVYFGKDLYKKLWHVAMNFQNYGLYKKEINIDPKDYMDIIEECLSMINNENQ